MGDEKLAKRSDAQKVVGKEREEDQECDGRTAIRGLWKEWKKNEEQLQKIGVGDC